VFLGLLLLARKLRKQVVVMEWTEGMVNGQWFDLRVCANEVGMDEQDLMLMGEEADRLLQTDSVLASNCSKHRLVWLGLRAAQQHMHFQNEHAVCLWQ
tara:strand:- start:30376 stop:30669 length:294 start_codon:yes stop_codon:yes gene_type:complete